MVLDIKLGRILCDFNGAYLCLKLVYDSGKMHTLKTILWNSAYRYVENIMMQTERKLYFSVLTDISKCMQVCLYRKSFHQQPGEKAANLGRKL